MFKNLVYGIIVMAAVFAVLPSASGITETNSYAWVLSDGWNVVNIYVTATNPPPADGATVNKNNGNYYTTTFTPSYNYEADGHSDPNPNTPGGQSGGTWETCNEWTLQENSPNSLQWDQMNDITHQWDGGSFSNPSGLSVNTTTNLGSYTPPSPGIPVGTYTQTTQTKMGVTITGLNTHIIYATDTHNFTVQ